MAAPVPVLDLILVLFLALALVAPRALADPVTAPSVARAEAQAVISSILPGTVAALPLHPGDAFAAGDALLWLDCALPEAEAAALRAEHEAARLRAATLADLLSRGGAGRLEVAAAKALAAAARARLDSALIRLRSCAITAPFDGRIVEYAVNPFEYVAPAQPVVSIVSSGQPVLDIIAPETWLHWIAPGHRGRVQFNAVPGALEVTITGIAPIVDPVSQTVKLSARFHGAPDRILPGMTGRVRFDPGS